MQTTILWFRRDLRLHDNPALNRACDNGGSILPIYIHAPQEERPWAPGAASRWWLHHSLLALDTQLRAYGLRLHYFAGASESVLAEIIQQTGAGALVFNRLYEPHLQQRDRALEDRLGHNIKLTAFDAGLLATPGTVLNNQQQPYRVFTPFYKKLRPIVDAVYADYPIRFPLASAKKLSSPRVRSALPLQALGLLDSHPWHHKLAKHWTPGESHSLDLLDRFVDGAMEGYPQDRDIPSVEGTSRLSPGLHFGELTPQQIYRRILPILNGAGGKGATTAAEVFLRQLIWREFAHHILWHFPQTATQPMNPRYKKSFWRSNRRDFSRWTAGKTGIPIVDAGMRQLWETGWMHNRVRMITSSLLTKNMGINWTQGAHWFWETLVDANLANNTMGWQWVAGCGVDASPYYRIFNPVTQAKRFDPRDAYIRQWLPDYQSTGYPAPMVDLASSRQIALARYQQDIKSG
ncbi:MAG: deoxyribodipyrimidine photo-lyase [Gammaproteobacteria bacterium]|nr:deoxyribodipyrimidine photo-lyase [Gammaproteobacteria bacterium]